MPGSNRVAVTDADGRFDLGPRPPGNTVIAAWYAGLDSLGLGPLTVTLTDTWNGETIVLATPPPRGVVSRHCGLTDARDATLVFGTVRDQRRAPYEGLQVVAFWSEPLLENGRLTSATYATLDTTDANGFFALCGVPGEMSVVVRASGSDVASGERLLRVSLGLNAVSLIATAADDTRVIEGRVVRRDAAGVDRGVVGADVEVAGSVLDPTRTDSIGRFRLLAPTGTADLNIKAIGFEPLRLPIPDGDLDAPWIVSLEPITALDTVRIRASRESRWREEFERRRATGLGRFVTDSMLQGHPRVTPQVLGSLVPGVVVGAGSYPRVQIRGSSGICDPRIFEDGVDLGTMITPSDRVELARLIERAARVEIYRASSAPARFNDFNGCGSILIWTQ
jgi:hypothetical protein